MKQIIIILTICTCLEANAQTGIKSFFKPIPKPDLSLKNNSPNKKKEWRPVINLPAFKIVESSRPDAKIDALMLTSTGGGISWQKLEFDTETNKWKSNFSFSPITILVSGNLTAANPIDITYATTVGFFNNLIMFGAGYDLGAVTGRSRIFGLVSIGINLNN